jgi:hypothetical protein
MQRDDQLESALNPHRAEERVVVARETVDRLRSRGIEVSGRDNPAELGELLAAVERFEEQVELRGGDLMVDDLNSSEPDDPHFVVPRREPDEQLPEYTARIDAAAAGLRGHPSISE